MESDRVCETVARTLALDHATSRPLSLCYSVPSWIPAPAIILVSRDYAPLPRGTFSGTRSVWWRNSLQFGRRRSSSSPRSNALEVPVLLAYGNTLGRAELRLSVWLPRIMDATVTHVNEACHLHLLRLRRLAFSSRISICSSDDTSPTSLSYLLLDSLGISRSERTSSLPSVFNFISRLASYFLPSFPHWRQQRRSPIKVWIRLVRKPIQDNRLRSYTHSWCSSGRDWGRRVQTLTGFDERMVRTLRDQRRPMILEYRSTNSGLVRGCPPTDW